MFLYPLSSTYKDHSLIVALCDVSRIRMQYFDDKLRADYSYPDPIALYHADEFDRLLREQKPDVVIVTSVDATHADYIVPSLHAGCDVIVEKPIAVSVGQLAAIERAARATGRSVRVAFNCRWFPSAKAVWDLIAAKEIGEVCHVHFEYLLDTSHGADYFRRWHARMEHSGGLLVHKSTHHFDLVNWWLDSIPETVSANGRLAFYGKENAIARGDERWTRYDRYLDPASQGDPFRIDLLENGRNILYHEAEADSGYIRDRNVFRDDVDIYDTMSVIAKYRSGALLTYSLMAYSPYEGFRVSFTGDRGRLEFLESRGTDLITGQGDSEEAKRKAAVPDSSRTSEIRIQKHFGEMRRIPVPEAEGGHFGADPLLQEQLFSPDPPADGAHRAAGWEQGFASAMLGISANHSIATGKTVCLNDLLPIRPDALKLSELV